MFWRSANWFWWIAALPNTSKPFMCKSEKRVQKHSADINLQIRMFELPWFLKAHVFDCVSSNQIFLCKWCRCRQIFRDRIAITHRAYSENSSHNVIMQCIAKAPKTFILTIFVIENNEIAWFSRNKRANNIWHHSKSSNLVCQLWICRNMNEMTKGR